MELSTTPSKSSATALSNAADTLEEPIPRRLICPPEPEPPTAMFSVGTREASASGLEICDFSRASPPMDVMDIGTSCSASSRRRAVTMMTASSTSAATFETGSVASCAFADVVSPLHPKTAIAQPDKNVCLFSM